MKTQKLFTRFAQLAQQYHNCAKSNNSTWQDKARETAETLCKDYMPSGSGIDSGTEFDIDASNENKLVFKTSFHHMNDGGFYDGWTVHQITVRANMAQGYSLGVSGRDRNQIKEYLHEVYSSALSDEVWSLRETYLRQVEKLPEIKINSTWLDGGSRQVWQTGIAPQTFPAFADCLEYLNQAGKLESI
jgi:hypothetical protein